MTTKSRNKLVERLNRSEGISLIPIIAIMVIMSVMGGVFASIMGSWNVSAPATINSTKAYYLAETAAMFALQDAGNRFYGGNFNVGTSTAVPYVVSSVTTGNVTEEADYWFEMPDSDDDVTTGTNDDDVDDDYDDSDSNDDVDGDVSTGNPISGSDLHTIIATGKVKMGSTTVAKRQIKVSAFIYPSSAITVKPGVQTTGGIIGTGGGFGMVNDAGTISTSFGVGTDNNTGPDPETGIVYRPPNVDIIEEDFVKANAIDQGHYNAVDLVVDLANDDYPEPGNPSYYYDAPTNTIPNFTYVGNDFTVNSNRKAHGVIWVKGNVVLDGTATMDAVIICEGDITFNGTSDIVGGIVHYGSVINGNGNPTAVTVEDDYFSALSVSIPVVTVQSWQEAVSAN